MGHHPTDGKGQVGHPQIDPTHQLGKQKTHHGYSQGGAPNDQGRGDGARPMPEKECHHSEKEQPESCELSELSDGWILSDGSH